MLAAGGPAALAADVRTLKEAVVFGAACGALTATRKGAIEGQPGMEESAELAATAQDWYNFW
jgi:sugar/nucleoside kinase (ribokinase family)